LPAVEPPFEVVRPLARSGEVRKLGSEEVEVTVEVLPRTASRLFR